MLANAHPPAHASATEALHGWGAVGGGVGLTAAERHTQAGTRTHPTSLPHAPSSHTLPWLAGQRAGVRHGGVGVCGWGTQTKLTPEGATKGCGASTNRQGGGGRAQYSSTPPRVDESVFGQAPAAHGRRAWPGCYPVRSLGPLPFISQAPPLPPRGPSPAPKGARSAGRVGRGIRPRDATSTLAKGVDEVA